MNKRLMVCGADCIKGGKNCNGHCEGKADSPPEMTDEQKLCSAKEAAHGALDAASAAWYTYAGMCDVGPERERAFEVYDNVRMARRVS